ncbi:DNA damage-induced cell division inhibitor SosA [Staphylococcus simulans]|uniref:DNA damage-induced cell division inhibitor SosA n=1 Tax=Staphylococcus simulans TaxID=1286 RepID=UPI00399BCC1D
MIKKYQTSFLLYIAVFLMSFMLVSAFLIGAEQSSKQEQVYEMTDHTLSTKVEQKAEQDKQYIEQGEQNNRPIVATVH